MPDKINITIQHSMMINMPCELVWDFTQDFTKRTLWDKTITECKLISDFPQRKAFIKVKGGMTAVLEYKLFNRPFKTSLRMINIHSPIVADGGGSWSYEKQNDSKTMWTQTNSISLKNSFAGKLLKKFVEKSLKSSTIESMQKAKYLLETSIK